MSQKRHGSPWDGMDIFNPMQINKKTTIDRIGSMGKFIPVTAILLTVACIPHATQAQSTTQNRSTLLSDLAQCRVLSSDSERLACYDRTAAALDQGEKSGQVVVMEKSQIMAARRDLFGFSLPSLPSLFSGDSETESLSSIETNLVSATQNGEGKWVFRLADNSEWRQIDSMPVRFRNRPDEAVRVRNASLGSFLLTVGGSRAVRVRRQ